MAAMALVEVNANDSVYDPAPENDDLVPAEAPPSQRWPPMKTSFRSGRLPSKAIYPIWRIRDRELARPIVVTIEAGDADVVMCSSALRVWGVGDDTYAALRDFEQTFDEVLQSYAETPPDRLTVDAKEYLNQLRSYLPRV